MYTTLCVGSLWLNDSDNPAHLHPTSKPENTDPDQNNSDILLTTS